MKRQKRQKQTKVVRLRYPHTDRPTDARTDESRDCFLSCLLLQLTESFLHSNISLSHPRRTDGPTDRRPDRRTDASFYRIKGRCNDEKEIEKKAGGRKGANKSHISPLSSSAPLTLLQCLVVYGAEAPAGTAEAAEAAEAAETPAETEAEINSLTSKPMEKTKYER